MKGLKILIIVMVTSTACRQNLKHESSANNTGRYKFGPKSNDVIALVKQDDSLITGHQKDGVKRLSCCTAPPSRFKVRAEKK